MHVTALLLDAGVHAGSPATLLSVTTRGIPEVPAERSVTLERLGHGFVRIVATFGFMQSPNIPEVLARAAAQGVRIPPMETSYYLGRERLVLTADSADPRAIGLYRSVGFLPFGREPAALKIGQVYVDNDHMSLDLNPARRSD